ncbi:PHP domain-containing protein [Nocardioides sp.]|uniref:PHP domain-containing protein n=1 Tax=Nocardioides sp. TaxID=35761 RepID=UPI00261F30E5|nr:PHP domain-containing protein [Nocardioides sp.]
MRIDLHTHSLASDGTQTPTELVTAAKAAGLDVVAITDHDGTGGWDEAVEAARRVGIELVRGIEISTKHRHHGVHLLAYLPDPTHVGLRAELDRIVEGRSSRAPAMVEALGRAGIEVSMDEIAAPVPGRPHVADALVRQGVVATRDEAFEQYLNPGRPGYVNRYAADLTATIRLVTDAGGVTVLAHPWGRGRRGDLPASEIARLRDAGLSGVEVDHQDHTSPDVREELRAVARELDLVVTGSSDHHGLGKSNHELGCHTTAPAEYARLMELAAAAAAAASGRRTPEVVRPG